MTTKLNFARDVQGYNSFAAPVSTDKYSATLTAGGNSTITLPTNSPYWIVSFSFEPGADVWVAYNGLASAPAGATFASTTSELLPGSRVLPSTVTTSTGTVATTINLFNNGAGVADIGVILYAIS
jgi:hypothetical protein